MNLKRISSMLFEHLKPAWYSNEIILSQRLFLSKVLIENFNLYVLNEKKFLNCIDDKNDIVFVYEVKTLTSKSIDESMRIFSMSEKGIIDCKYTGFRPDYRKGFIEILLEEGFVEVIP